LRRVGVVVTAATHIHALLHMTAHLTRVGSFVGWRRLSQYYCQLLTSKINVVHMFQRVQAIITLLELYERKTAGLAGIYVLNNNTLDENHD
jgi:hypothetical protein